MKRFLCFALLTVLLLCGCAQRSPAQVVATTLPVYEFSVRLCQGSGITVAKLVTENVSCLHDYTLTVPQMQLLEASQVTVINGAGLEDFLSDALTGRNIVDASQGLLLLEGDLHHDSGHVHGDDPHIWLSPANAKVMAQNICSGLQAQFPHYKDLFSVNLTGLMADLDALQQYADTQLRDLSCRELITFHDGFSYLADSTDLTIIQSVEEEAGSEASAAALIGLIQMVDAHHLPAIFTEVNGATAAASIISAESGVDIYMLDMAISGDSYFEAMYQNINTLKEALQ